jgi:ribose-phosphate pyrophosphokinase
MTTMALTSAPMRRLFDRLDFAPRPREAKLASALAAWDRLRSGRVAPMVGEVLGPGVAVFVRTAQPRDYALERDDSDLPDLIGALGPGARLSSAPKRRPAALLRRLIDLIVDKGEPVLATFTSREPGEEASTVDLVATPVAGPNGRICGALIAWEARRPAMVEPLPAHAVGDHSRPILFALGGSQALANAVARRLGVEVALHEERDFEDGEHKIRPLRGVRNHDVYVLANLTSSPGQSVNDKLCKLLFFIGALKQSAARRVTLVAPYLCYARKERQTKPRDPVVTRYLAQALEAVGVDRVVTVTAHDLAAFQNAFRCATEHVDVDALFAHALKSRLAGRRVSVVSPDPGGEKRAELFRQALERTLAAPVGKALVDKMRSLGKVTGELFVGDVAGRTAIVLDDMISTGGTMARAAAACRARGASEVIAVATHGLFVGGGEVVLSSEAIDEIWVTDSLPPPQALAQATARGRARITSIDALLAAAIERCHAGGSINELLEHESI